MTRIAVPLIGDPERGEGAYRVNLPTYRMIGDVDYENRVVIVEVPDECIPPQFDRLVAEEVLSPAGTLPPLMAGEELDAWHEHLDAMYAEHRGEFRPIALDYHDAARKIDAVRIAREALGRTESGVDVAGGPQSPPSPPAASSGAPAIVTSWLIPAAIGGAFLMGIGAGYLGLIGAH